ncbi:MAG: hypothetical protein J6X81_02050, partial [Muribaculaceae bacterium]|nr:hypothetical protein [Muribaculaceae bacterium]
MKTHSIIARGLCTGLMILLCAGMICGQTPDYLSALGLNKTIHCLGTNKEDGGDVDLDFNYYTYEFNRDGQLISYDESETVEGSYSETVYFSCADGIPYCLETTFVDYWADSIPENGIFPATVKSIPLSKIYRDGNSVELSCQQEGYEMHVMISLDKKNRISQVRNLINGKNYVYFYGTDGVPRYTHGEVAFPQLDIIEGHRLKLPKVDLKHDNLD